MRNNFICIVLLSLCIICLPVKKVNASAYDSFWEMIYENFEFLPEYHIEADIFMFFLHKNSYFKNRYYLENNTDVNFVFLSFKDLVYSVWYFELQTGMGQTPGNVVFDPMDINFGIIPAIEFRIPEMRLQCGLNHHCFHEIDRKDFPTIYWNKLFLVAGSENMHLSDFWQNLLKEDAWNYKNRFSWYVNWGFYLRKFFGLVRETTINGENWNVHDFTMDARFAIYRRRSWIFSTRGKTVIGYWKEQPGELENSGVYWRQDFSLESNFRRGKRGAMIFLTYTLDEYPLFHGMPRLSKDNLLQIGVRFFN